MLQVLLRSSQRQVPRQDSNILPRSLQQLATIEHEQSARQAAATFMVYVVKGVKPCSVRGGVTPSLISMVESLALREKS